MPQRVHSAYATLRSAETRDLLSNVGNTPLISLRHVGPRNHDVRLLVKAEWFNPSGSVKARSVLSIIETAEREGALTNGKTILDSTSGNAGLAYAMIAAGRGYRVKLTIPRNMNAERKHLLRAYGAELVYTDPLEGSDGAIKRAREICAENPASYFYADQYSNDANWKAHYETTGQEIWNQTGGSVTHFVAGIGTGGTLMGTGRRLRECNSEIQVIAVQPDSPFHGLEGLKHIPTSIKAGIYEPSFPDRIAEIGTEAAQRTVMELAKREGILVGPSSGAAIAASLRIAEEIDEGTIVALLPESGERYLSEKFWEE